MEYNHSKLIISRFIFFALAFLAILPDAGAQIIWQLKHIGVFMNPDLTYDTSFCFTAVSCSGNDCTAAALKIVDPDIVFDKRITFFRSTDGGKSWDEQISNAKIPLIVTNDGITKLQQIDSLNVVGIGDSGTVVRTFDGGKTWERQQCPTAYNVFDVHFSDSLTGIAIGGDTIFLTSDGGKHWDKSSFTCPFASQCHSYGNGKFRLFKYFWGKIYTTFDYFKTVDSTQTVFDSLVEPRWYAYALTHCTFSSGETILAYGRYRPLDTVSDDYGLITRTVDGGKHWEHPFIYPTIKISQIDCTTPLDRDTIYADGLSNYNLIMSTDRGASWRIDTIRTDTSYLPSVCYSLAMTGDGHPISIFSFVPSFLQSILTRGEYTPSHVEVIERIIYNTHLYPNPALSALNIESIDRSGSPVRIADIFGRDIMHGVLSDQGKLTLDFSRLPKGVYNVLLNHYGSTFSVGKVVLIGK